MTFQGLFRLCAVLALQSQFFIPAISTPVGECAAVKCILDLIHAPGISAEATKFCSSYLSIPLVTSVHTSTYVVSPAEVTVTATLTEPDVTVTATTTEPDVTDTAIITEPDKTVTKTITSIPLPVDETSTIVDIITVTTTSRAAAPVKKRAPPVLPPDLQVLEVFLGKGLSTACSCLSITPSTVTSSAIFTTSLPTPSDTITGSITPTTTATDSKTPTVTITETTTPTVTVSATTTLAPVTDIDATTTILKTTTKITTTTPAVVASNCNPGGAQPTFQLIASDSGSSYDGEFVSDVVINSIERLDFVTAESSALSFTFNDNCNLVSISNGAIAYVTTTSELTEVFLFAPGAANYDALVCSVTAANTLDCAIGVRDFATCPSEGNPTFFEDGPTSGCAPITLSPLYLS